MQRNLPSYTVTDPVNFEWDALVNVLEGVLSQIFMVTERSFVAAELYLIEELLKYLSNSNDPLILSVLLFCISSLFVSLSMSSCQITAAVSGVQLLPLILDNVSQVFVFQLPDKTRQETRSVSVKNLRRYATSFPDQYYCNDADPPTGPIDFVSFNKPPIAAIRTAARAVVVYFPSPFNVPRVQGKAAVVMQVAGFKKAVQQIGNLVANPVASTLKARVINNKAKAAIVTIKDIASTPLPKRKRKINGSGDVSTLDLDIFSPVRLKITPAELPRNGSVNLGHFQEAAQSCYKLQLVFGNCGVISVNLVVKGYVEMVGVAPETSQDIAEEIIFKGGRYLEAQVSVKRGPRVNPDFYLLFSCHDQTRGHADHPGWLRLLFEKCQTCFEAISRNSFYFGNVGNATKIYLVLQIIHGVTLADIAERLKESMMQHVAAAASNVVVDPQDGSAGISVRPSNSVMGNGAFEFDNYVTQKYFARTEANLHPQLPSMAPKSIPAEQQQQIVRELDGQFLECDKV
ncbi:3-hydroxyisobutyrate dehydrogenase [Culex quinquefasciatus]|uniref:3-hydroxyisobutyrate dehydrogenase n=1 Tax=Culex quinquefasciatus TaxID=7176 RepID=B0W083_CULQU|nr:3-hydroxyisobutyrate dehydrogenase [Culex quinquefasciatus]|eukprot:XP_001842117.1 3-hydroxyisobutyrate dehydrogenase [Culex quinquefasciatus]